MRQSCTCCAKTFNLQKEKKRGKRECKVGNLCLQYCVFALKERQTIPTLHLHRFGECVPAAASSSCAYVTGEETDIGFCSLSQKSL